MRVKLRDVFYFCLLDLTILSMLATAASPATAQPPVFLYLPVIFLPEIPLPNGDFEAGATEWTPIPAGEQFLFDQAELPEGITARSGSHVAWMGSHQTDGHASVHAISQQVVVPEMNPVLFFWMVSNSKEKYPDSREELQVWVNGALLYTFQLYEIHNTYTWDRKTINLSAYANQTIDLKIQVITDDSLPSEVYLDDFGFSSH